MAEVFKAYDIRGEYGTNITEDLGKKVGNAFVQFVGGGRIVVGRDVRTHSPSLAEAVEQGVRDAGATVVRIGDVTTPMSYFATGSLGAAGGIMVTASHNPAKDNGFKICREEAKPVGRDTGLRDIQRIVEEGPYARAEKLGGVEEKDILDSYVEHVLSFGRGIGPMKVVFDTANGAVGLVLPRILQGIESVEATTLFLEPDGTFPNHEPNPLKLENVRDLQEKMKEVGADLGIAFDGDGDRCAVLDETGTVVPGDLLTGLIALEVLEQYPGASIVYDQRSSMVVREEIESHGGKGVPEKTGHSYMKATMRELDSPFGGELSGHFYFKENYFADSGLIAMIRILSLATSAEKPFSEVVKPFRRYHSTGEVNFRASDPDAALAEVREAFEGHPVSTLDGVTIQLDGWWFNLRKSNTEPLIRLNVEGVTRQAMDRGFERLRGLLGEPVTGGP